MSDYSLVASGSGRSLKAPSSLAGKGLSCDVRFENDGDDHRGQVLRVREPAALSP